MRRAEKLTSFDFNAEDTVKDGRVFVDVDVQFDFCDPAGALYVAGSPNEAFRRLTAHAIEHRIPIVGSLDSHAWDAWEFASNANVGPAGEDPRFPDHCVKGTRGWLKVDGTLPPRARFAPNVEVVGQSGWIARWVSELLEGATQGVYFEKEVFSLFANPAAEHFVRELANRLGGRPEFVVYGVATDYCVRAAALGLVERGHRAAVVTDAIAGITPDGVRDTLAEMSRAGVRAVRSSEIMG